MMGTMSYPNDPKPWEVLDSKYLSRKPWLTVRQDHVRLPSGSEMAEYFVLGVPRLGQCDRDHDGRQNGADPPVSARGSEGAFRTTRRRDGRRGCNYETSARRELLEETGYGGGQWQHWMTVSANPSTNSNRSHTYLAHRCDSLTGAEAGIDGGCDGAFAAAG